MDQLNMAISAVCEQAAFFRKGNGFQQQRPPTRLYQHISTTTGKIKSSPIRAPQVHKADPRNQLPFLEVMGNRVVRRVRDGRPCFGALVLGHNPDILNAN